MVVAWRQFRPYAANRRNGAAYRAVFQPAETQLFRYGAEIVQAGRIVAFTRRRGLDLPSKSAGDYGTAPKVYNHPAFRNGGTGLQSGLGRTATEKAVALLLASILFAVFAFTATAPRNELSRFRSEPEWWESDQNPAVSRPQPSYSPSRWVGSFPLMNGKEPSDGGT